MVFHLRHLHFFRYLYDILLFEFDTWFLVRHLLHTHTIQYFVLPSSFNPLSYSTITTSSYKSKYRMDSIERDYYELSNMMAMLIATYVFWCQQIAWLLNKSTRIVSTKPQQVTHVIGCRLDSKIWFGLYLLWWMREVRWFMRTSCNRRLHLHCVSS